MVRKYAGFWIRAFLLTSIMSSAGQAMLRDQRGASSSVAPVNQAPLTKDEIFAFYYYVSANKSNKAESLKKLQDLAGRQDNAYAQALLAALYFSGEGVTKDPGKGIDWLSRAAEQGDPDAMWELGQKYYQKTKGVPQNKETGLSWLSKAAAVGDPRRQYELGETYLREKIQYDGIHWMKIAAVNGYPAAQEYLTSRGYAYNKQVAGGSGPQAGEGVASSSVRFVEDGDPMIM